MYQIAGYIGRKTLKSGSHILDLFAFTYKIFELIFQRPKQGRTLVKRVILEQIYFTAVQALPLLIPIALIVGSMLIMQFARISSQYDTGTTMVLLIVRELGPGITALLVILRSATSVTIETGYMKVFHEIDTIEMAGLDPIRIICLPRLIGITSAILCLFIVFDLVSIIGGYGIVWVFTHIYLGDFLGQIAKAITLTDIIVGIVKALCFGIIITVTCLYYGFSIKKNITGLPVATSKAAIECFFYCLLINVVISTIFYM
ncbi:MAG: ABC transporter permease [Thermodesulfobacteriota bacterium]|nr:ABC transporter permease [Thermodesulfobacteriota bacterium]